MTVMILDDNSPYTSGEALELLLRSILPGGEFEQLRSELGTYLRQNPASLANHEAVLAAVQRSIVERFNTSPVWQVALLRAMEALVAHAQTTTDNRTAYSPGAGKENPHGVFWPNPTQKGAERHLHGELPYGKTHRFLTKQTPLGSMGSCFALEIAHRFQNAGFNYVVTERYCNSPEERAAHASDACAAWGTIFNIPAMRQLIEKSFGVRTLPRILFEDKDRGRTIFCDPFREGVHFESPERFEATYDSHLAACREALTRCKVFVATLGLNEVWYLKGDGSVLSRCPWRLAPSLLERRVLGVDENLRELEGMLKLWRTFNPEIQLIVTVSPVPLHATFRGAEHHVIAANCHSKSTLRVVAEEFVRRNTGTYYFPSYETVMYCTRDPWEPDLRHVARHTVDNVMKLFSTMFITEQDAPALSMLGSGRAPERMPGGSPAHACVS